MKMHEFECVNVAEKAFDASIVRPRNRMCFVDQQAFRKRLAEHPNIAMAGDKDNNAKTMLIWEKGGQKCMIFSTVLRFRVYSPRMLEDNAPLYDIIIFEKAACEND